MGKSREAYPRLSSDGGSRGRSARRRCYGGGSEHAGRLPGRDDPGEGHGNAGGPREVGDVAAEPAACVVCGHGNEDDLVQAVFQQVYQTKDNMLVPGKAHAELLCVRNPDDDSCLAWFDVLYTLLTMRETEWVM